MFTYIANLPKSPILHFLILGVVVFIAYGRFKPPDREVINITTQTIDALVQQRESITQHPVTAEQRQSIIEGYIEDEVLLREAYKRDFDKNDYRVRKQLLNLMRSSLSEVIAEPSISQLRAFYESNQDRYLTAPSRSFEQIFFSFTSTKLPDDPQVFIRQLEHATDISELGDFNLTGNRYTKAAFQTAASTFGKPFAEMVFNLPLDIWWGPVESFRGIHFVRVTGIHDPELPPFEQMESYLRTDYFLTKSRESQTSKIEALMNNYEIVVEGQ